MAIVGAQHVEVATTQFRDSTTAALYLGRAFANPPPFSGFAQCLPTAHVGILRNSSKSQRVWSQHAHPFFRSWKMGGPG